jgi:hypothetical protein
MLAGGALGQPHVERVGSLEPLNFIRRAQHTDILNLQAAALASQTE